MKKILFFILIGFTSQIVKSQPKNYVNTENATLEEAFYKNYEKIAPGCLEKEQLKKLKQSLQKWNVNLDSIKTMHFYYSKDERDCKSIKSRITNGDYYFMIEHKRHMPVTKIYKPLLYVKPESVEADEIWKNDVSNYFFNLFFKDLNRKFISAAITVNSNGIYFTHFNIFDPVVFNAFSNEVGKYNCD
ncbi:MAG TPA: hypothetical protein VLB74_03150 [Flavobacterium sp.]|uniref:hypothetical protein n=1 Tax=Flavobacterium sp. TaxID=239 RepID=UPI002C7A909F|nr:hypothetical protein [Flavobacterium sp.]HSD13625.1 hypothetical protein [Flavobacterium sp.]